MAIAFHGQLGYAPGGAAPKGFSIDRKARAVQLELGDEVVIEGKRYRITSEFLRLLQSSHPASRDRIREEALKYLGTPYVYGGNRLEEGVDTSHFVSAVLTRAGVECPPPPVMNQEQSGKIVHWKVGRAMRGDKRLTFKGPSPSLDALRIGDRLIFQSEPLSGHSTRHTAIYIGAYGKWKHAIVHASRTSAGVRVDDLTSSPLWRTYRYAVRDR